MTYCNEELRLRGMESNSLNFTLLLLERSLSLMFGKLMNEYRSVTGLKAGIGGSVQSPHLEAEDSVNNSPSEATVEK